MNCFVFGNINIPHQNGRGKEVRIQTVWLDNKGLQANRTSYVFRRIHLHMIRCVGNSVDDESNAC